MPPPCGKTNVPLFTQGHSEGTLTSFLPCKLRTSWNSWHVLQKHFFHKAGPIWNFLALVIMLNRQAREVIKWSVILVLLFWYLYYFSIIVGWGVRTGPHWSSMTPFWKTEYCSVYTKVCKTNSLPPGECENARNAKDKLSAQWPNAAIAFSNTYAQNWLSQSSPGWMGMS